MKNNFIKIAMGVLLAAMLGMFTGCSNASEVIGSWGFIVETSDGIDYTVDTEQVGEDLVVTINYTGQVDVCYLYDPYGNGEHMDPSEYTFTDNGDSGSVVFNMPEHNVRIHLEKLILVPIL